MSVTNVTESIMYLGVDDKTLDLFESQYVIPEGVSYNSYMIKDRKIAVMDTVDNRATDWWFENVEEALDGKAPDYLIVSHMEPDHAANIQRFLTKYPETVIVASAKAWAMMPQFFDMDIPKSQQIIVSEADTLKLGNHTLQFFMAPMVHWPEVMVTYEQTEKILFSADGFGKFGALNDKIFNKGEEDAAKWTDEARRYFINIVGKYGPSVQALLKKASGLEIEKIAPLHGPVLIDNLGYYIDKYSKWSSYTPEEEGVVIAYASIHGNTAKAAREMSDILKKLAREKGKSIAVKVYDLARCDQAAAVADAYRYDRLVLAGITYDGGLMPCMEDFLYHLKMKNYQNRKVGIIENGSWGPIAGKLMTDYLAAMKNIQICDKKITIKSAMNAENKQEMTELAEVLVIK